MSITTLSLIESLIQHDRPSAWWGLDTADPLVDDSGNGYTLTALAAPTNSASLFTRGDTGASGCRDFNGTTQGYFTNGKVTAVADGPPAFHASSEGEATASTTLTLISPDGIQVGDLILYIAINATAAATVTTAPTGYTQVGSTLNAGSHAAAVYKKTAVQADTVPQEVKIIWNSADDLLGGMLVYRGLDTGVSGLIFDSGQQATSSDTFHFTTTESYPDAARQVVIWTKDIYSQLNPDITGKTQRISTYHHGNLSTELQVVDYEQPLAGSGRRNATTTDATQLGAFILTFGSPRKVLDDTFDTITGGLCIYATINVDTVAAGSRTILYKQGAWILQVDTATVRFWYHDGTAFRSHNASPTLSTGTTYRIWVKDDGSNITFFINGTKTTVARFNALPYATNTNRISVAHFWNGAAASEFLDGRIDELAIFTAPLSDQQILAHETAATAGTFGGYIHRDTSGKFPRVKLELATDSKPTDYCHVFSDVTTKTRINPGITCQRGRNFELDRMGAGTMSFVLANRDRSFDSLKPRRVVRLRAQTAIDGVVFPIFFGYTEAPRHGRPGSGLDQTVQLTATDAFKAISLDKINDTFVRSSEMPGARIAAVLESVTSPPAAIDAGVHEIVGDDLQGINRLDHCQGVAETDGGVFFADARGRYVFQDNQYRSKFERTVRATYGGENTTATYVCKEFEPEVDETRLYTAAAVTPASGVVQRMENAAAALEYFPLTKEVSTLHSVDSDALAMATHIVNAYSAPLVRVLTLSVQPIHHPMPTTPTVWAVVLGHEISHRIKTIEKMTGGSEVPREHFIEGITHTITGSDWIVGLPVSPTELEGKFFIVGTSQIGDANAVIGW